jgi:hypothetical protein
MASRVKVIKRLVILISISGLLIACSTQQASLVDQSTGADGTGKMENTTLGNSGPLKISFPNEQYTGTWVAVRDSGYGATGGATKVNLQSNLGNRLVCEFRYSLITLTGIGTCRRQDGKILDLQIT